MRKSKVNNRILGAVLGLIGPLLILLGLNVFRFEEFSFLKFISNLYELKMLSTWLKPAVLINLAIFFLALNFNKLKTAQGVIFATLVYGFLIVYLTFA